MTNTILAANPSDQVHLGQTVLIVVPISGFSTAVAITVYVPLCVSPIPVQPVLNFWIAIQKLSEFAYLRACDKCTQTESQELLAQLSSWAVAFLPIMNDSEPQRALKILRCLGSRVLLSSGARGLLSGWTELGWLLISAGGRILWAQSAEIFTQIG
jgi:hypothetical protein